MAKNTPLKLISTLLFLFLVSSSNGLKITTRLIHRDSVFSPHYNASLTTTDLAKRMVGASLARHLTSVLLPAYDNKEKELGITPPLLWVENKVHVVFYVNFSIGNPPIPQLAVLDSASSLLWVRCPPCTHCSSITGATYFHPSNSKTYSPLPCTNDYCSKCTPGRWLWSPGKDCMFTIEYLYSKNIGVYAYDQMTFRTNNDDMNTTTVPHVLFGCSQTEIGSDYVDIYANGIMGLGKGFGSAPEYRAPFVNRLGGKFSYCVGSTSNRSYPHNRLSFGDAAQFLGKSTPLIHTIEGYYFLTLINISIGGDTMLNIGTDAFNHGTLIDSGTELTLLRPEAIDAVKAEVKLEAELLNVHEVRSPVKGLELCFRGTIDEEGNAFNYFVFHFDGGAELMVDNFNIFWQVADDIFCLAIMRSNNHNVVGMIAQQGYNVGYDMDRSTNLLYFQKVDCEFL